MISGAGCALDGSVLVLNKFFTAVHVISVRRAFCLLFKELAEVITIDDGQYVAFNFTSWREASQVRSLFQGPDDEFIRPVHFEIQVPRIIRLLACDRLPRRKVSSTAATFSPGMAIVASIAAASSPPASSASTTSSRAAREGVPPGRISSAPA